MKKRNFLALLLAFVMVLCIGVFASCGTQTTTATATTITLDVGKIGEQKAGDKLDVNKLKITVGYSDDTQKEIAVTDVTLTVDEKAYGNEALTEGEHTVKVSYVPTENAEPLTDEKKIGVSHVHNYGAVHKGTPATCMAAGTKDYYECACGKKFVKNGNKYEETTDLTIAVDANAHSFGAWTNEVEATCVASGTKGHKDCSLCNKHFDKNGIEITDLTIVAKGHDFENGTEVADSRQAATCIAKGEYTKKCSRCEETKKIELEIDENAHNYGEWHEEISATCVSTGTKGYKDCSLCNKHFDKNGVEITDLTIEIDSDAHDFKDQPYVNNGADGHYQVCKLNSEHHSTTEAHAGGTATCKKLAECTECNAEYGSFAAHTYGELVARKAATIDAAGNVEYKTCSVCEKNFDKDGNELATIVIPQLEAVTISFSGIERNSIRIEKGTTTTIEEPVKADNVFVNWTDAEGKEVDVTAAFNEDVTLTANFKEGYNFKKNHAGATATTTMDGAKEGTVSENGNFETGIRYNFPSQTSDNNYYVVTLPCINYSKFTVVAFNWKARGWTQVGLEGDRYHEGVEIEGTFEVVNENGTYKAIWMCYSNKDIYWSKIISDSEIIGGTKGLNMIYALTYAPDCWLDIEVSGVSHVYDDGVLQRVSVCKQDNGYLFRESYANYDPNENAGDWTLAIQAIDYTKYASVTFNWNFTCEWARLGLNTVSEVFDTGTKMSGTLVIAKNAEGKYVATLTDGERMSTKELSEDVANGKKGIVVYFGSDIAYRQLNLDAIPTYEALPAE